MSRSWTLSTSSGDERVRRFLVWVGSSSVGPSDPRAMRVADGDRSRGAQADDEERSGGRRWGWLELGGDVVHHAGRLVPDPHHVGMVAKAPGEPGPVTAVDVGEHGGVE